MANKIDFKVGMPSDAELDKLFNAVPKLERYKVLDKTVDAAAAVVVKRARELTPRNKTPNKRSASQRSKADWTYPLWKTIGKVIRRYQNRYGLAVIGPRWPKGNKAYFNTSPRGRRQVLWGKVTGKVIRQVRNWIVEAFDQTLGQQLAAMKAKATELTDKMMREK